jgi:hypothetical protein
MRNNTHTTTEFSNTNRGMSKAPLTRSTELPSTGLPATWNTTQAVEGFHTVDCPCEVSCRQTYCRISSLVARDSSATQLHASFQRATVSIVTEAFTRELSQ